MGEGGSCLDDVVGMKLEWKRLYQMSTHPSAIHFFPTANGLNAQYIMAKVQIVVIGRITIKQINLGIMEEIFHSE